MAGTEDLNTQKLIPVDIEAEMKESFINYAVSVIVDRALPDVRDGLKPVHRRILYSMFTQGFTADKPYRNAPRLSVTCWQISSARRRCRI